MKLKTIFLIIMFLIPQMAHAEMDQATVMMIQQQQHDNLVREQQNDRDMFHFFANSIGGSQYGEDYARKYGCAQAKAMMFGANVRGCNGQQGRPRNNRLAAGKHSFNKLQAENDMKSLYIQTKPFLADGYVVPELMVLANIWDSAPMVLALIDLPAASPKYAHKAKPQVHRVANYINPAYTNQPYASQPYYARPNNVTSYNTYNRNYRFYGRPQRYTTRISIGY